MKPRYEVKTYVFEIIEEEYIQEIQIPAFEGYVLSAIPLTDNDPKETAETFVINMLNYLNLKGDPIPPSQTRNYDTDKIISVVYYNNEFVHVNKPMYVTSEILNLVSGKQELLKGSEYINLLPDMKDTLEIILVGKTITFKPRNRTPFIFGCKDHCDNINLWLGGIKKDDGNLTISIDRWIKSITILDNTVSIIYYVYKEFIV